MRTLLRRLAILVALLAAVAPLRAQGTSAFDPNRVQMVALVAGGGFTCGLEAYGQAWCWGTNQLGQLGAESPDTCRYAETERPCALIPQRVAGNLAFRAIDAGHDHACGLTSDGTAYCWGSGAQGELGTNATLPNCDEGRAPTRHRLPWCARVPVPVDGNLRFTAISAGSGATCALSTIGEAFCWGSSGLTPDNTVNPVPKAAVGNGRYVSIATDLDVVCAVTTDGAVDCWDDWAAKRPERVRLPAAATQVTVGWGHACAVSAEGAAWCWGMNQYGQVGDGVVPRERGRRMPPTPVHGGFRFASIHAGLSTTCGLTKDAQLVCWGRAAGGMALEDCAGTPCTAKPTVLRERRTAAVAMGTDHACAQFEAGIGICWGRNATGAFGHPIFPDEESARPRPVVWAPKIASPATTSR
jgi:alpha-tubulin suppressor-like RCC1 family protein